ASNDDGARSRGAESEASQVFVGRAEQDWEVNPHIGDGLLHLILVSGRIQGSANDLHSVRGVLILNRDEIGHLPDAGAAIRRPEVQHYNASAQGAQLPFDAGSII